MNIIILETWKVPQVWQDKFQNKKSISQFHLFILTNFRSYLLQEKLFKKK